MSDDWLWKGESKRQNSKIQNKIKNNRKTKINGNERRKTDTQNSINQPNDS